MKISIDLDYIRSLFRVSCLSFHSLKGPIINLVGLFAFIANLFIKINKKYTS